LELDFGAASQNGTAGTFEFAIATLGGAVPVEASSVVVSMLDGQPERIAVESDVIIGTGATTGSSVVVASLEQLEFRTAVVELAFAVYGGNFDFILDRFPARFAAPYHTTPCDTPCDIPYLVSILIGCRLVLAIRCHARFTLSGSEARPTTTSPTRST